MQRKQPNAVTIKIDRNQASALQLLLMLMQYFRKCRPDHFRYRVLYPELDNARQVASSEGEYASKIEILSNNDRIVFACISKDILVGISDISDVLPVGCGNTKWRKVIAPPGGKILIENEIHAAIS